MKCARRRDLSSIGLSFDACDGVVLFVAFQPGKSVTWDLPPLEKKALPNTRALAQMENLPLSADGDVAAEANNEIKRGIVDLGRATQPKGAHTIELMQMIEQQIYLLYGATYSQFSARSAWFPEVGEPPLSMCGDNGANGCALPSTLVFVSDQGGDIQLMSALLKHCGVRVVTHADHNHRDNNDAAPTTHLRMAIEMVAKCTQGPFMTGIWFKSLKESARLLQSDQHMLTK